MANSIGLRIYRITITNNGDSTPLELIEGDEKADPHTFVHKYFSDPDLKVSDAALQRSWNVKDDLIYSDDTQRNYYGIFKYGIFGFESEIVDTRTGEITHNREVHEAEQIPLTFHVWSPNDVNWGYISFQSFQSRSCVTVVQEAIKKAFEKEHPDYTIRFQKISPADGEGKSLFDYDVKEVRLIKSTTPSDKADAYAGKINLSETKLQLSILAKRNKIIGKFTDVFERFKGKRGEDGRSVVIFDGAEYDQAVAKVMVGKKTRMVGIVGYNNDAGVIDITSQVKLEDSAHPTPESVYTESNDLMMSLHEILKKQSK